MLRYSAVALTNKYTAVMKYLVWERLLFLKDEPTQSLQLPSCAAGHMFFFFYLRLVPLCPDSCLREQHYRHHQAKMLLIKRRAKTKDLSPADVEVKSHLLSSSVLQSLRNRQHKGLQWLSCFYLQKKSAWQQRLQDSEDWWFTVVGLFTDSVDKS